MELSTTIGRNQGAKIPNGRLASIGQRDGGREGYPIGR